MNKLNKKGFTLIELMAVVIILIIIIFIAITRISRNVDETENNAVKANAGAYIKAVNGFIQVEAIKDPIYSGGYFTVSQLNELGVNLSGTKPDGGAVLVANNEVSLACLTYNGLYITFKNGELSVPVDGDCSEFDVRVVDFEYTGNYQKFVAPISGKYKIELWGASGYSDFAKGAYTSGEITLDQGEIFYVYVGGSGSASTPGYNGGGVGRNNDTLGDKYGGGATDVRYFNDTPSESQLESNSFDGLKARIMVAGGGGGVVEHSSYTYGNAGGLTGYTFVDSSYSSYTATGGTQTSGGTANNYSCTSTVATAGTFGQGGNAGGANSGGSGGGGGGYFGGAGGPRLCGGTWGGGGGSSFISGYNGCNAISEESTSSSIISTGSSEHFSGLVFEKGYMIDGKGCNWVTGSATNCGANQDQPDGSKAQGHTGNGFARITILADEPEEDPSTHLTIYYDNGTAYETFYTDCDLCSDPATFGADRITLGSGYYGNFYTDTIDLSLYNTLIFKRTNGISERIYFNQNPQYANSGGESFNVLNITTDLNNGYYLTDISNQTRSDLHFTMNHYYGTGSGEVYYIAFSTKTVNELLQDLSFLP